MHFTWSTPPGCYRAMACWERELTLDHRHTFLTKQGHGGPPQKSDQPYAGAISETTQTWKTTHTKHTLSRPNKANMEWWLRWPNDIRGSWGAWSFLTFVLQVRKNPEKSSSRKPVLTRDWTQAHCVTSAHATTCSTAVDLSFLNYYYIQQEDPLRSYSLVSAIISLFVWIPILKFIENE